MKGSLGLLKFIGDVTKIMALLMGFYNVQKVLSLGYVLKRNPEETNYGKLGSF